MYATGCLRAEGRQLHVERQKCVGFFERVRLSFGAVHNICLGLAAQSKLEPIRGGFLVVFLHDAGQANIKSKKLD